MAIYVLIKSLIVNTILVILKIIFGFVGSSSALIADGFHSLSDLTTDVISIIGLKAATRKADKKHPYGHGKIEYLLCILIGIVIIFLGGTLIIESFTKENNAPKTIVMIVTIITILTKYLIAKYISKKGEFLNSSILTASGEESLADVYSSIVVLISYFISQIYPYADKIATIIIAVLIISTGLKILKENISSILDEKESNPEVIEQIKKIINEQKQIIKYNNLRLIKFGSYYKCELTIFIDGNQTIVNSNDLVETLKKEITKNNEKIKYINIYVKPYRIKES